MNKEQKEDKKLEAKEISPRSIVQEMEQSYLDYAMSVIVARALPDARDGLKPVHRRIIYTMGEIGLSPRSKHTKSAKIVGEVLGKYHPHGDVAVYDTMVGMAQSFKMNHRLVDGQGNWGSVDGDPAAAQRYTEARMGPIAGEMLADIEKETVNFTPNYDDTLKEPTVLPTKVPNLLLNGTVGIAVGMATNIPPHNLREICEAATKLIDNPQISLENLMEVIKGPDFPTGGTIYGVEGIKNAFATGHGKIIIRGDCEIIEDKRNCKIIISSIPFQVNKANLISKVATLTKEKKTEGITDIRDESDRTKKVRIVIELKQAAYPKKILNQLYNLTSLQTAFHINMLALVERIQPRVLNLREALQEFINHRKEVIKKRTRFDLDKAKERTHILQGLRKALDNIDKIIKTIKKSKNRNEAQKNLCAEFKFTTIQANAILEMRLSALAALERQKVEDELKEKLKLIEDLTAILKDTQRILTIIKKELHKLGEKYGKKRQTRIIAQEIDSFEAEDLIPNEAAIVTLTKDNYIKRVPEDSYRKQRRGGKGMIGITPKEQDQVLQMETASTHDFIYFFTNRGRVFASKVFEIPTSSRQSRGQAIVNLIQASPEEKVTAMLIIPKDKAISNMFFIMGTKFGIVKKTKIEAYKNIRKTGLIAISLKDKDELKFIKITNGQNYLTMVTRNGQGILFEEREARPMGRSASGVIGIRPRKDDEVIAMGAFDKEKKEEKPYELVTVLENGYGKRTAILKHFPLQKRGGYGVRASKSTKKTGKVIGALICNNPNQDIILVSRNGKVIRIPLVSAKRLGRDTQGVRLMRIKKDDRVASFSSTNKESDQPLTESLPALPPVDDTSETPASKKQNQTPKDKKMKIKVKYYKDANQKQRN